MEGRERYQVGERILHSTFGNGLVVEVRDRGFYDVLEVAFEAGVKRLTSIHPDIVGRVGAVGPALELVPPAPAPSGNGPAPDGADGTGGRARPGRGGRDGARSARRGGNGPGPRHHDGHAQDGDDGHTRDGGAASDGFAPAPRARRDGAGQVLKHWPGFSNAVVQLDGSHRRLLQRYRRGALSSYREVRLRLKAAELAARLDPGELLAFDLARDVVRYAHQVDACRRVIGEMRGRALLADEVGLGKTIEAGIVLSEYRIRGLVRRALLLVPAALQSQWRSELWHKFGIRCHIRERGEDFDGHDFLITTLDTARVKRNQERILDNSYDLVIIDEAHRLKNHRTLSYQFASALASRYLLLLTATPVHNDLRELYNLVTLLRPGTLGTYSQFRRLYVARGDRRIPRNTHELSRHLARVMIRTRREDTDIRFPKRIAEMVEIEPTVEEASLYEQVSGFIRGTYRDLAARQAAGWHLALMTLQKEIGSSPRAAVGTLQKLATRCPADDRRREALVLAECAQSMGASAKLAGLLEQVQATDEKVIVFTQFRGTLRYLAQALEQRGIRVATFYGGMPEARREESVRDFRQRAQVLVSTDAGGEGRNFQFCHRLVNFDLPWNPMKVEQRIGRIHRLGQEHDVTVHSFTARGTLESHVLAILQKKLRMFELVVGELDMILGHLQEATSIEDAVFKLWTLDDPDAMRSGFRRLGDDLERARLRHEMIEDLDRSIFESIARGED